MTIYDFNEPIDRIGTHCEKYDNLQKVFGLDDDVLPMWVADTDFKTPDFIIDALKKRLEHPVMGYSFRCRDYENAIISWIEKRNGWKIEPEWLDFTPGVVCGLSFGVNTLSQEGDKIVIQPPVYPPFARTIEANNRIVSENPLKMINGRYEIDFDDLEEKLKEAKLFILCNPHNPTGRVFDYNELMRIGELCLKYGVYIISDEIHSDLILKPNKHIHIASISKEIADITLTYLAPSKTFNIAGLSTAVAIIPNSSIHEKYTKTANKIHADQGNIFGAIALCAAYNHGNKWVDQLLEYIDGNARFVCEYIQKNIPEIKCYRPESTFLMWLDFRDLNLPQKELCDFLLHEAKIALNNGTDFGSQGEGFMRMNIGTQRSVIKEAMNRLKRNISDQDEK